MGVIPFTCIFGCMSNFEPAKGPRVKGGGAREGSVRSWSLVYQVTFSSRTSFQTSWLVLSYTACIFDRRLNKPTNHYLLTTTQLHLNKKSLSSRDERDSAVPPYLPEPATWADRPLCCNGRSRLRLCASLAFTFKICPTWGLQASSVPNVLCGHRVGLPPGNPDSLTDNLLLLRFGIQL